MDTVSTAPVPESAKRTADKAWGAPQVKCKTSGRARGAGDSAAARSAGSSPYLLTRSWGLRPRLYSAVRFADWALKLGTLALIQKMPPPAAKPQRLERKADAELYFTAWCCGFGDRSELWRVDEAIWRSEVCGD